MCCPRLAMSMCSSIGLTVVLATTCFQQARSAIRPLASRGAVCEGCPQPISSSVLQLSADFEEVDEHAVDGHESADVKDDKNILLSTEESMTQCSGGRGCDEPYDNDYKCQCNTKCIKHGDCCSDFVTKCLYQSQDANGKIGKKNDFQLLAHFWGAAAMISLLTLAVSAWVWSIILSQMGSDKLRDITNMDALVIEEEEETFGHDLVLNWIYIRFREWKIEEQYDQWSITSKVQKSAQTLAFGVCIMSGGLAFRLVTFYVSGCAKLGPAPAAVACAALVAQFALSTYCAVKPTESLYWITLAFSFLYVPFSQLPPMAPSCYSLHMECRDAPVSAAVIEQAVRHADCGLQGQTSMQILLTWILLSPWLIPRQEVIHLVWFWLIGIYCGWSYFYEYITDMHIFTGIDTLWRVFVLAVTLIVATSKKYYLEKSIRLKFAQEIAQRHESKKMFGILEVMMPSHVVVPMMLQPGKTITEPIPRVSILFVLINEFEHHTRSLTPKALLAFLNEQFTQYDSICEKYQVTKIETVGEEYVAAVGVLPEEVKEDKRDGHQGLLDRLFQAGGAILGTETEKVKLKMGIHTGSIVAGVIGNKLPRYRLFGDTINSAARMMQKGLPGQLQFGEETYGMISAPLKAKVQYRGEVEMKGKGKLKAWVYVPAPGDSNEREPVSFCEDNGDKLGALVSMPKKSGGKHRMSLLKSVIPMMKSQNALSQLRNSETTTWDDPAKEAAFSKALTELEQARDAEADSHGIFHTNGGFSEEVEEEWMATFHRETFCKKIVRRFGMTSLWVLVLTGAEYMFIVRMKVPITFYDHPLYSGRLRMTVFLVPRLLVLFVNMVWWYLCESSKWVEQWANSARSMQSLLLVTELMNLAFIWISYDAMGYSDGVQYKKRFERRFQSPDDQSLILNFVLLFNVSLSMHKFRYVPAMMYVPVLLMLSQWYRILKGVCSLLKKDLNFEWEDNFSWQGEFLLFFQLLMHLRVAQEEEMASRSLFKASKSLKTTMDRTQKILTTLMPEAVVAEIKDSNVAELPCHQYRHLCIAQADLCGFTQLSATKQPQEVVQFMGDLFGMFDDLTDKYGVYKVETVGDAYIAGMAEKPLTKFYKPVNVILFGLDMVRATDTWSSRLKVKVTCRVGIHYGECIGGVVGNQMQRYHLFGDTLNIMEILESTSEEGRVQISPACKAEVQRQLADEPGASGEEKLEFVERTVDMLRTSKGDEHHFSETGGPTFLVKSNKPMRLVDAGQ